MEAKLLLIPIEIYRRGILVFIGSKQELIEYIKRKYPSNLIVVAQHLDDEPTTLARVINTGTDAIIFAEEMPSVPTLIHEAYHAAHTIHKIVGIDPCDEEAYAYLLEYICTRIFDWLNIPFDVP